MKNWRPITLLCADYKIATRAIAGRLLKVLATIVSPDQSCGVPGRFIGENVALLRDAIDYLSTQDIPAAVLSLDQDKAFDRVEWPFLFDTLQVMGFGPDLISWIRHFYSLPESAVLINGYQSPFFSLSRGVRQGCPLSPLLYVSAIEVLACNIHANPCIISVSLPSSQGHALISQYTDDTSIIVTTENSIFEIFKVYRVFERASGAKLNLSKCKGLCLGPWNGRSSAPVNLYWSSEKVKTLGGYVGPTDLEHTNWDPRINALENTLNSWKQRTLSLQGRMVVINMLALSRLWYVASLIPTPQWVISRLNTLIFSFFWKGKRDLVDRLPAKVVRWLRRRKRRPQNRQLTCLLGQTSHRLSPLVEELHF